MTLELKRDLKRVQMLILKSSVDRNKISRQLHAVHQEMAKKQQTIVKLKQYQTDYQQTIESKTQLTIHELTNDQIFIDKLMAMIASEENTMAHLKQQLTHLSNQYHTYDNKVSMLEDKLSLIKTTLQHHKSQAEDKMIAELVQIKLSHDTAETE